MPNAVEETDVKRRNSEGDADGGQQDANSHAAAALGEFVGNRE